MAEIPGRPVYRTPKNHQRRQVPVPAFLIGRLAEHVAGKDADDLVFASLRGGMLWRNNGPLIRALTGPVSAFEESRSVGRVDRRRDIQEFLTVAEPV